MSLNSRNQGYSLIELVVTLGITAILLVLSMQIVTDQQKLGRSLEEKVSISVEAQRLSLRLGKIFESAGGQGLFPWQSIFVENNCAARWVFPDCQGSDRITLMTSKIKTDNSLYLSYSVNSYDVATGDILLDSTKISDCSTLGFFVNEAVVIFLSTGELVTRKVTNFDPATCVLKSVVHTQSAQLTTAPANPMTNSTLNIIKVMTFFYDRTNKKIFVFIDYNNDAVMDSNEISSEFTDVYDFQVALGCDFAPRDGAISDGAYSPTTDEWLYNLAGEAWGAGDFNLAVVKKSDLKMIRLSLIRATYSSTTIPGSWKVLDGPAVSGNNLVFRPVTRDVIFRNATNY